VALYLQRKKRDKCSVSGGIQYEGETVVKQEQLTMTMTFFECTQLLELKIPNIESETNLVELCFSLRIHVVSFEDDTLRLDPSAQLFVFLVHFWHIACNARRETC
jgi:hypothetical protein